MTEFTPLSAAVGGLLIGLGAVLLMSATGRIAGISGHLARLLPPYSDHGWLLRFGFLFGIAAAPWLYKFATAANIELTATASTLVLLIAGLLVGFGTVVGSGCTSGHGVCGVARLSRRSLVATAAFMASGMLTVFIVRHLGVV